METKLQTEPNVLKAFAQLLGTEIKNWRLEIPQKFGKGYCSGFVFNQHIRMMVFNYELNEDLIVENPDVNAAARTILFKFQNIFPQTEILPGERQSRAMPSVLIATRSLDTEVLIPVHTNTSTINIEVNADYLNGLFYSFGGSAVLQSLLRNTQPLLFEQIIYPSLQKIVDEMIAEQVDETFKLFFLRVKAEELICRLLMVLQIRDAKQLYPLNKHDVQTIYKVKERMLERLETPPVIKELAASAGMSPTKLKRLFKQVFGNSIFNYYQDLRMKEAALLLKEDKLSVSDVGYRLGFTNLSHFSRVFKDHTGMKPKQYSQSF
ncbi:helix-turn-helix domain-containing protein [Mucilaginibacter paludis]|uniref:Transcriptional regulator, AraC family n=1 Tax=Mucilaginibacter paludis DSM 18603 TaxID=714943 RepID=H1YF50_9SPHI|nr:AraC family transcriptional regulator [Mucilaginibacter paludis]EHQ25303.1 transcriptional regulator, AraC family [Mucilaginibacter paludis DSM 18603]